MKRIKVQGRKPQEFADWMVTHYGKLMTQHLQGRGNLQRDDLEYLVEKVSQMKDERLAQSIAELIGWGDDERAEVETFVAIALELMRTSPPSRIQAAARMVEIKVVMAQAEEAKKQQGQGLTGSS